MKSFFDALEEATIPIHEMSKEELALFVEATESGELYLYEGEFLPEKTRSWLKAVRARN